MDIAAVARVRAQLSALILADLGDSAAPGAPDASGTWPDIDHDIKRAASWPGRNHLLRARSLAGRGQADAALAAVRWWVENDPLNPNWWHNQIGTPRLLGETLILLGDAVPADLLESARGCFSRSGEFLLAADGISRSPKTWTGANRLWMSANRLLAAALYQSPRQIADAVAAGMSEVRISCRDEEGIQVDGSFHQHGPLLYNGGYGINFLSDSAFFIAATRGTPWEPEASLQAMLADFLLDGTRWMLRGEDINHGCRDREITRPRVTADCFARIADLLAAGPVRSAELRDLAAAIRDRSAPGALRGNRMFYRSDFMAHQAADHAISVRMHSARTLRGEVCNNEGLLSHHLADGLTYLVQAGDEYHDVFPVWDWQKTPGTTVVQTPGAEPAQLVRQFGLSASVGGVSDGEWGACSQHLLTAAHTVRKSWFFGPGAVVCLGSDLHSGHASVVTTLDQSLRQGPVEHDSSATPLGPGRHRLAGARWLRHGPWSFVFPAPLDVDVELGSRTGAWSRIGVGPAETVTKEVFLAYCEQGPAPSAAAYAYAILAGLPDRAAVERASAAPGYVVVENSARVQAVWWPAINMLQAILHDPAEVRLPNGLVVACAQPCGLQLRHDPVGDAWTLHAADLTQKGGQLDAELRDAAGTALMKASVIAPEGDHAGRSVRVF